MLTDVQTPPPWDSLSSPQIKRAAAGGRPALRLSRESIEVRESTRVVLGDIPQQGVVRCALDSFLLLTSWKVQTGCKGVLFPELAAWLGG